MEALKSAFKEEKHVYKNPFSPIFGGKPGVFFGREETLGLFERALADSGSDDRATFVTGTRGSGKTALLEQFSIKAGAKGWKVIDLGPEDTVAQLVRELAGFDETTKTIGPQISASVLGFGGGVSAGSVSKTKKVGRESLQPLLLDACVKARKGVLVTIDEVQKVPLEDVSSICSAFQMASRKGHEVILVVAGLPYAYDEIIRHEGCTYLRRGSRVELALFTWEETDGAFKNAFSRISGLDVGAESIDRLNEASFGHPYLMQLLGYHLVSRVNERGEGKKLGVGKEDVDIAIENALFAYERRALKPLLEELPGAERMYLEKASECLGEDRLASTSEIAGRTGSPQTKLSRPRAYLINHGILAAPERGKVMFCVPYLADYVKKEQRVSTAVEIARQRRV